MLLQKQKLNETDSSYLEKLFILSDKKFIGIKNLQSQFEDLMRNYLKEYFSNEIIEPILLHVDAKKYLARNKKYFDDLSEASKTSLKLQGGIMKDNEAKQFEQNKNYKNAIKLRRFDEGAKKQNIKIKDIKDYKELLISKII